MEQTCHTSSSAETERLAENIGKCLHGGEVIELVSDLGGGKTTFVKGLARGFGSGDQVSSPTFTLSKVYQAGNKELHHFDFYRLPDPGILTHELQELVGNPSIVIVIEWAEAVHHVLPTDRLTITLKHKGENERELLFTYPHELSYLVGQAT